MMYGQTEATARMAYLDWRDAPKKIGSIGKSIPFTKMWKEKKKGEKVKKSGEIGELIFKGKNVSLLNVSSDLPPFNSPLSGGMPIVGGSCF